MTNALSRHRSLLLGALTCAALILGSIGLFAIGRKQQVWHRHFTLMVQMPNAGGIDVGTRVRIQGMQAGQVDAVELPKERGGMVHVRLSIEERFRTLLGLDAHAEIQSEGLIGGKVVEIHPGSAGAGSWSPEWTIPGRGDPFMAQLRGMAEKSQGILQDMQDLAQQLRRLSQRSESLVEDLRKLSDRTQSALAEAETLMREVRTGQGPLGSEIVTSIKQLQQTGASIQFSLEALKQMPVVGRYLDVSTRTLVRPNFEKHMIQFKEEDLFPPGRALFTPEGLTKLDRWAATQLPRWNHKGTEIVIVAYQQGAQDPQAAEVLTQRQAEAVRTYLIDHHKIDKLGWFTWRTVQALGMGNRPAPGEPTQPPPPNNRLEIIVFAPPGTPS